MDEEEEEEKEEDEGDVNGPGSNRTLLNIG